MVLLRTTVRAALLLANIEWDLRLTTLVMMGVLLVGAVVLGVMSRWRKRASNGVSASDQLAEFRSLYLEGAISKEEFDQLREVLGGELRRDLALPPADKPAPPAKGAQPEAPPPSSPPEVKPDSPGNGIQPG